MYRSRVARCVYRVGNLSESLRFDLTTRYRRARAVPQYTVRDIYCTRTRGRADEPSDVVSDERLRVRRDQRRFASEDNEITDRAHSKYRIYSPAGGGPGRGGGVEDSVGPGPVRDRAHRMRYAYGRSSLIKAYGRSSLIRVYGRSSLIRVYGRSSLILLKAS